MDEPVIGVWEDCQTLSSLSSAFFRDVRTPRRSDVRVMVAVLTVGTRDRRWGSEGSFATHG